MKIFAWHKLFDYKYVKYKNIKKILEKVQNLFLFYICHINKNSDIWRKRKEKENGKE